MNRRILLLSLALLALAGSLGWLLRLKWLDARAREQALLNQPPHTRALPPPLSPAQAAPASPADYNEVAQKTLFSQDRNPNLAIEPPPPPKPEPPMPPLPVYYGQMAFGADPVAILTIPKSPAQKSYHAGDTIGDFKLIAFDRESMTFDWNGKTVERKLTELVPKEGQQPQAAPSAPESSGLTLLPGQVAGQTGITALAPSPQESTVPPSVGTDMGGGLRACVRGDNSPAGTVAAGYKKVIGQSLMGPTCNWEQVK